MSTTSTAEQNDPTTDNREKYGVPPIVDSWDSDLVYEVDEDGVTADPEITEVMESDDFMAS